MTKFANSLNILRLSIKTSIAMALIFLPVLIIFLFNTQESFNFVQSIYMWSFVSLVGGANILFSSFVVGTIFWNNLKKLDVANRYILLAVIGYLSGIFLNFITLVDLYKLVFAQGTHSLTLMSDFTSFFTFGIIGMFTGITFSYFLNRTFNTTYSSLQEVNK